MKFTGYFNSDLCTFTVDENGFLIVTAQDGTEYQYNEERYDEDSFRMIRDMLIRDGVRDVRYIETRYTIKPEFLSMWGEDVTEDTVIDRSEVERLADEWDKPITELLEQLTEVD